MSVIDLEKSVVRWPLRVKIRRGIWTYLLEPLVRWWPKSLSVLRVMALRAMGAKIGAKCLILPGVKVLMPWNLILDDHVAIGRSAEIYNFSPITIGRQTVISQGVYLCTGSHDFTQGDMPLIHAPISIGSQCWVAAFAFVCPGVTIGDGVVIGARAVVTKSVNECWTVHAGNPSRKVKQRRMASAGDDLRQ